MRKFSESIELEHQMGRLTMLQCDQTKLRASLPASVAYLSKTGFSSGYDEIKPAVPAKPKPEKSVPSTVARGEFTGFENSPHGAHGIERFQRGLQESCVGTL